MDNRKTESPLTINKDYTLSEMLCLFNTPTPPETQFPLIGQLTHAWASTVNNNRAAVLNQLLHVFLSRLCKCENVSYGDTVRCHEE